MKTLFYDINTRTFSDGMKGSGTYSDPYIINGMEIVTVAGWREFEKDEAPEGVESGSEFKGLNGKLLVIDQEDPKHSKVFNLIEKNYKSSKYNRTSDSDWEHGNGYGDTPWGKVYIAKMGSITAYCITKSQLNKILSQLGNKSFSTNKASYKIYDMSKDLSKLNIDDTDAIHKLISDGFNYYIDSMSSWEIFDNLIDDIKTKGKELKIIYQGDTQGMNGKRLQLPKITLYEYKGNQYRVLYDIEMFEAIAAKTKKALIDLMTDGLKK